MYLEGSVIYLIFLLIFIRNFYQCLGFNGVSKVYSTFNNTKTNFIWDDALNLMSFHRNKMNEYLCRNYIASEIIEGYRNQSGEQLSKRKGIPDRRGRLARESLLDDPGSQKYRDWLSRTSTLEDIYRQFEHAESESEKEENHQHESNQDEDETTFTHLGTKHVFSKPIGYVAESHYFVPDYDPHLHNFAEEERLDEKEIKLKALFHYALTAIAFLSFAVFMVDIFTSLKEVPHQQSDSDYILVPAGGVTGPGYKTGSEAPENIRKSRTVNSEPKTMTVLNSLSSKALATIEGLAMIKNDNIECFQRALCQNSKFSKTLEGPRKLWIHFWSLGISWIGSKISKKSSSFVPLNAMKYLQATVVGLGSQDCYSLYPKCDHMKRRKKIANQF